MMTFSRDGAQHFQSAVSAVALRRVANVVSDLPPERAGMRLRGND
jgi:hypothetical protein